MAQTIIKILDRYEASLLDSWLDLQPDVDELRTDLVSLRERRDKSTTFIRSIRQALVDSPDNFEGPAWDDCRSFLAELTRAWVSKGMNPRETAFFVLSFKRPLFDHIQEVVVDDAETERQAAFTAAHLMDSLALYVLEVHLSARDEIISRQREEVLELSTPVVQLWDGILALPIIGVLDSMRTQQVMEALLARVVETQAEYAIVDITGVPAVDSVTAQHLVKTATAARFMGARCIISGIRPQIAQTMVTLGLDFGDLETHSTLASALAWALEQQGIKVTERRS